LRLLLPGAGSASIVVLRDNTPVDILTLVLVLVVYFVLQAWLLPKFGVPT
jgi:hypothetical protein